MTREALTKLQKTLEVSEETLNHSKAFLIWILKCRGWKLLKRTPREASTAVDSPWLFWQHWNESDHLFNESSVEIDRKMIFIEITVSSTLDCRLSVGVEAYGNVDCTLRSRIAGKEISRGSRHKALRIQPHDSSHIISLNITSSLHSIIHSFDFSIYASKIITSLQTGEQKKPTRQKWVKQSREAVDASDWELVQSLAWFLVSPLITESPKASYQRLTSYWHSVQWHCKNHETNDKCNLVGKWSCCHCCWWWCKTVAIINKED